MGRTGCGYIRRFVLHRCTLRPVYAQGLGADAGSEGGMVRYGIAIGLGICVVVRPWLLLDLIRIHCIFPDVGAALCVQGSRIPLADAGRPASDARDDRLFRVSFQFHQ